MNSRMNQAVSASEAVEKLQSGMHVFVHGASATPTPLLEALCLRGDLTGIKLYHLHTAGPAPFVEPSCHGRITSVSLFTGGPVRHAVQNGQADFIPVFLSDIPGLFRSGRIQLDAALLQVSLPDRQGCCSLGTSVDVARAAADCAPLLIAEINRQMPRTHGDSAGMSLGGRAIIALPSTAVGGSVSRIVSELSPGAGVVTTRGHVHWVVTEYGSVDLHGLSLRQRGDALISIAHPDFRLELRRQFNAIRHY